MNRIFLDVGANDGVSIDTCRQEWWPHSEKYKIYSWEPNPKFANILKSKNIERTGGELFMKAAWVDNKNRKLYTDPTRSASNPSRGSSMYPEKKTGGITPTRFIEVECMDFSQFIIDSFSKDDFIVMKFNTEGAEFDIFPHMISTGAMEYINVLFGEWHHAKVPILSDEEFNTLVSNTEKLTGKLRPWGYVRDRLDLSDLI